MKFKVGDLIKIKSNVKSIIKGFEANTIHEITKVRENYYYGTTDYQLDGCDIYGRESEIELVGRKVDTLPKTENQENSQEELIKYKIQNAYLLGKLVAYEEKLNNKEEE